MGSRRTWTVDAMRRKRREGWLHHYPFSYDQASCIHHFLSNVKRSKRFLLHLILTLSWCLKNNIRSRWEKFASSYNPFFRVVQENENSELFKKPEPGTQFLWEWTSCVVQPYRSLKGSEAEPTTCSRYSSFRGCERSLDPESLRRAVRHSWTNGASPIGLRRPWINCLFP